MWYKKQFIIIIIIHYPSLQLCVQDTTGMALMCTAITDKATTDTALIALGTMRGGTARLDTIAEVPLIHRTTTITKVCKFNLMYFPGVLFSRILRVGNCSRIQQHAQNLPSIPTHECDPENATCVSNSTVHSARANE